MTGELLTPGADRHYCHPPGWRHRRRLGVKADALWRCECGKTYRWAHDGWESYWRWEREYPGGDR